MRITIIKKKNPNAFKPLIENGKEKKTHKKGCNCKRSKCLKNYCECFQFGVQCSKQCKCYNCKNNEDRNQDKKGTITQAN